MLWLELKLMISNLVIYDKVTTNYDELDLTTTGLKKLVYTASDDVAMSKQQLLKLMLSKIIQQAIFIP